MPLVAFDVTEVFVEIAESMVADVDVIDFLDMVTRRTCDLVSAQAAGLLLADDTGRLQLMAATTHEAHTVELFAVQSVEGPCQDCFRHGAPIVSVDLKAAGFRWRKFAPLAVEAGFRSVHAFPLRLRGEVIGALTLFGRATGDLDADDARVVQALADVTTIGLLQDRVIRSHELRTEQLRTALESRATLEQAKGALAQIHGCSVDEAFTLLRTWCHDNDQLLGEVAHGITAAPARFPELTRTADR